MGTLQESLYLVLTENILKFLLEQPNSAHLWTNAWFSYSPVIHLPDSQLLVMSVLIFMIKYSFHIFFYSYSSKKTPKTKKLRWDQNFFFFFLISLTFFFLEYVLFISFYLCPFLPNLLFLWSSFFICELRNMKQLLAQCNQPGRPGLCLPSITGGSYPKLWFLAVNIFQVLSPLLLSLFFSIFSYPCRL